MGRGDPTVQIIGLVEGDSAGALEDRAIDVTNHLGR
jgi:hypothetical protein